MAIPTWPFATCAAVWKLVPNDTMLRRLLARDLSEQGFEESLALWAGLIAENPNDHESLVGRVQTLIARGKPG